MLQIELWGLDSAILASAVPQPSIKKFKELWWLQHNTLNMHLQKVCMAYLVDGR